jgi:hypothetical protein
LLFLVKAKHSAELCPGGTMRPDKEFIAKVGASIKKSGVKEIGGYMDAPGHAFYFILETDDNAALNNAVDQLRLIGEVKITPVLNFFAEGAAWARKIGIQR